MSESAPSLLPHRPAGAPVTQKRNGCLWAAFLVIAGLLSWRLVIGGIFYWQIIQIDQARKIGAIVGTVLMVLLPVWWLVHSWRRQRKLSVVLAMIVTCFLLYSGGSTFRKQVQAAQAQEKQFMYLMQTMMENGVQGTGIDTAQISSAELGPTYPLAMAMAGVVNDMVAEQAVMQRELEACGFDAATALAPETLADSQHIRATRQALGRAFGPMRRAALYVGQINERTLAAVRAANAPEKLKQEFIAGMMETMDTAAVRNRAIQENSITMFEQMDALLGFLESRSGTYVVLDGEVVFADPADQAAYQRLAEAMDRTGAEVERDMLAAQHDARQGFSALQEP